MNIGAHNLLQCFFRCYLVSAAYNPQGLQNIGFLYAIDPGLRALYAGEPLRLARLRHAAHFNSHPFFTPMLLGAYLYMEKNIAEGKLPPEPFVDIKETAANTLSGLGDSLFSGTCLNTWALVCAILVCNGLYMAAFGLSLCLLAVLQVFKFTTFILGSKLGLSVIFLVRGIRLSNAADVLKCVNAVLLAVFLGYVARRTELVIWAALLPGLIAAAWLIGKATIGRLQLAYALAGVAFIMYLFGFIE